MSEMNVIERISNSRCSLLSNYVILESQYPFVTWTIEKFLTGGKIFDSFKEVHDVKKKIQKMGSSSIKYKVQKNTHSTGDNDE